MDSSIWINMSYRQLAKENEWMEDLLNCINLEWNSTNSDNCLTHFDRFFLSFASCSIAFKLYLTSLANGNSIKHVPTPNSARHLMVTITLDTSRYCTIIANKYLIGIFASNGNLWMIEEKQMLKHQFAKKTMWKWCYCTTLDMPIPKLSCPHRS